VANTLYRSTVAITTLALRRTAYERLMWLMGHLDDLNLNLVNIQLGAGNFIEVTLNNPLPSEQVAHLGLTGPV
jgi:hypothetical protein